MQWTLEDDTSFTEGATFSVANGSDLFPSPQLVISAATVDLETSPPTIYLGELFRGRLVMSNRLDSAHRGSLVASCVVVVAVTVATPGFANSLLYSLTPDRSGALPLEGAVLSGEVYVFFEPAAPTSEIKDVEFYINGALEKKHKNHHYDLATRPCWTRLDAAYSEHLDCPG